MAEKVVCIDDSPPRADAYGRGPMPVKGEIYTIRGRHISPYGSHGVLLYEITTGGWWNRRDEIGYRADRFAPVKETNIEIFREIDRKIFNGETVDA